MADEPTRPDVSPEPSEKAASASQPQSDLPPSGAADSGPRDRGEVRGEARPEDRLDDRTADRADRGISDFVRRAVSAGVGAASKSKDDIMRAAAAEVRTWLEHLNLNEEVTRALSRMVIEVKTEIRFRPQEDGKIVAEASRDVKVKGGNKP